MCLRPLCPIYFTFEYPPLFSINEKRRQNPNKQWSKACNPLSEFAHVPVGDSEKPRRRRRLASRCRGSSSWGALLAWTGSVLTVRCLWPEASMNCCIGMQTGRPGLGDILDALPLMGDMLSVSVVPWRRLLGQERPSSAERRERGGEMLHAVKSRDKGWQIRAGRSWQEGWQIRAGRSWQEGWQIRAGRSGSPSPAPHLFWALSLFFSLSMCSRTRSGNQRPLFRGQNSLR
jgi:hypothetical protein